MRLLRQLGGRRVALTGRMSVPRALVVELVTAAGGQPVGSVSGGAGGLLVIADADAASGRATTKRDAAGRQGWEVLTESEFAEAITPTPEELLRPGGPGAAAVPW